MKSLPTNRRKLNDMMVRRSLYVCTALLGAILSVASRASAADANPIIYLEEGRALLSRFLGTEAAVAPLASEQASGLSLISADFDQDGVADLAAGYAAAGGGLITLRRGNIDVFAPQSQASFDAIGRSEFGSPFLRDVTVLESPVRPDLLAAGDFYGQGQTGLVAAAKGGSRLALFTTNAQHELVERQSVDVGGAVTALATYRQRPGEAFRQLVVSVETEHGAELRIYSGSGSGLTPAGTYRLPAAATMFRIGDLDRDAAPDVAMVNAGALWVMYGRDLDSDSSTAQPERIPVNFAVANFEVGVFVRDQNPGIQLAVLSLDGSVHFLARDGFDARPMTAEARTARAKAQFGRARNAAQPKTARAAGSTGWMDVETVAGVVSQSTPGPEPLMFRSRISSNSLDDVMILNARGNLAVIAHPDQGNGKAQLLMRPQGAMTAAVPARVNIDGREGVIALPVGNVSPLAMGPLPDPTFIVNTTLDILSANACTNAIPGQCSLRQAIVEANAIGGTDTIMVPAGVYTLTLTGPNKETAGETADYGSLNVTDHLNIIGATDGGGNPISIIQAGTDATNGIDKVLSLNPDGAAALNFSLSNLVIRYGRNPGSFGGGLILPHGFGGGIFWEASNLINASGNLTITNTIVTDNTTLDGDGGGIAVNDLVNGAGVFTMTNSIVQNNTVNEATSGGPGIGGGVWVGSTTAINFTDVWIRDNRAIQTVSSVGGMGGGLFLFNPSNSNHPPVIHGSTFSGNQAAGAGGGIYTLQGLTIDQASIVSGNSAPLGGGVYSNLSGETTAILRSTITGNTAVGSGGGVFSGASGSTTSNLVIGFSRLAGNTSGSGQNLASQAGPITATNNWWGVNAPETTISIPGPASAYTPYIVLAHTASPNKIGINQSSVLTADLSRNSGGTQLVGNLGQLTGLSATFNNAVLGSITTLQPVALGDPIPTATSNYLAFGTGGSGSANVTVDQQTVTASIAIVQPPSMTKSFAPTAVAVNASATMTLNITNGNSVTIDASFTDTFPAGLVVAATPNLANTCGGSVTATAGSGSVSFTNAALPVGSCTISISVTSASDGNYNNSVTINSTEAGNGNTPSASLSVANPPAAAKAFGVATIPVNGTTSLTITLTSTNSTVTLTGVSFTDNLPAGLVVAATPNANNTCGGTATATAGGSAVSLSGATLAPGESCAVSVNVTGATSGLKNNSVQATATQSGAGNTANASLTVVPAPVLSKVFGAASIPLNGTTSLTFTLQNASADLAQTAVAFSDTLPAGLVIATPNGLTGSCGAGTITATQATNAISLAGGSIPANSSCNFAVNVTGTTAGTKTNTTGSVSSLEGGPGNTATANIDVVAPPSISKAFSPTGIAMNGASTLTFTIANPAANAVGLTGVAFTDTFPTGLAVATPNSLANTCGGTVTAVAGSGSVVLAGGTVATNSSCTVAVNVTSSTGGSYTNTTGNVTSTNGGSGNTATSTLTVAAPPSIGKSFGAATIPLNGSTSLTLTVTNPAANAISLTQLAFTDSLPAGLVVATPSNLNNACGGAATATAGSGSVTLAGATLAPNTSCAVSLNVTGTTAGVKNNSVPVTSLEAGAGNTANASVTVVAPPGIAKVFGAATVALSGSTSLTFTLTNSNATVGLTGVGFTDTLPGGLQVATPNGLSGSCGSGVISAVSGSNAVSLAGGTIGATGNCSFSVNVTGIAGGVQNNTTSAVTSTEGGTGGTASASVTVLAPDLTITKSHSGNFTQGQTGAAYTLTVTNSGAAPTTGTVTVTDTLPAGLTATAIAGTGWTCTLGILTCTRADALANSASYPPIAITVNVAANAPAVVTNTAAVSGGGDSNTANNTATDPTTVIQVADLTITKAHSGTFVRGQSGSIYTLTVNNAGPGPTTGTVTVVDTLPAGLTATAMTGTGWSCTLGTLSCTRSDVLAASASYPSITLTVNVASNAPVQVTNTASVSGGGELNAGNNSASDVTAIGAGVPATIAAVSGTPQIVSRFSTIAPFSVVVRDSAGYAVQGATVTFNAEGILFGSGLSTAAVTTDAQGGATSPAALSGGSDGTFLVRASVPGVTNPAVFSITVYAPSITVNPGTLTFDLTTGSSPSTQTVDFATNPPGMVQVHSDATWMTLGDGNGDFLSQVVLPSPGTLAVRVNPAGLSPGRYTAQVELTGAGLTTAVAVVLDVRGPASLVASPSSLTFSSIVGQPAPASQTTQVTSGGAPANITATASASWISVTAGSQATPSTLTVSVNPANMAAGTYTGSVQVTAAGAAGGQLTIPVTLKIAPALSIDAGGIVNDASFLPGPGAPNTIMALFGKVACPATPTILVDGIAVEVLGATATQVNFTLPASIAGQTSVQVQVNCGELTSEPAQLSIAPVNPAIFSQSQTGTGQGAVLNQNYTVNGSENPAAPGSYLAIYGTGFGTYGATANGLTPLTQTVTAFVGDVPAQVQFAGHAPGYTLGLQQVNILIPNGAPSGAAVPVRLTINGVATQTGITVAIQ